MVRDRWERGAWGVMSDTSSSKRRLAELVTLKLQLLDAPRLRFSPFQYDLCCAQDELESQYVIDPLAVLLPTSCWPHDLVRDVVSKVLLWQVQLTLPGYIDQKKGDLRF